MPRPRGPYNPNKTIPCPVNGCEKLYSSTSALGRHLRMMVDRCVDHRRCYLQDTEQAEIEQEIIELGKKYASESITADEFTELTLDRTPQETRGKALVPSYMDDKMAEVLDHVESIKEKVTDAEYKALMDSLGKVHDIGEPDWDSIWIECVAELPNFGNAVPAMILTKVQLAETTTDRLRLLAQYLDHAYHKLHENEHTMASLARIICKAEHSAERTYLANA